MKPTWNRREIKLPLAVRLRNRRNWHALARRRFRAGLTTRGTKPKRLDAHSGILGQIEKVSHMMAVCFPFMPPAVKKQCLELSGELSALKKMI